MNFKSQISNLKFLWWYLRQVSGDAAYENYLRSTGRARRSAARCAPDSKTHPVLSRREFYLDALHRRYAGVSRCC